MGWALVISTIMVAGACDDTKATCEKMCNKMGECMPAQVEAATKSLPGDLGDEAKKKMEEGFKQAVDECKATCDQEKEVTEAEKTKIAKAKECLDKDCAEFISCIEKI